MSFQPVTSTRRLPGNAKRSDEPIAVGLSDQKHVDALDCSQHLLPLDNLPVYDRNKEELVLGGLMIDYWCRLGDKVVLSGWFAGTYQDKVFETPRSQGIALCSFRRPDVEVAFPSLGNACRGFLAVLNVSETNSIRFCSHDLLLTANKHIEPSDDRLWLDHRNRLGFLLENYSGQAAEIASIGNQLESASDYERRAQGFLEQARGVVGFGGIVAGWIVTLPGVKAALMDTRGNIEWLDRAVRWHRNDIVEAYSAEFGNLTFNAGFLQAWRLPLQHNDVLRLVAFDGNACYILGTTQWKPAPIEPTSFARWAFSFPTPPDRFADRLDNHDGSIIESLLSASIESRVADPPRTIIIGTRVEHPICSVVVPLYGRHDFMANQLLAFSDDKQFGATAELIYVVDDPRMLSEVEQRAWLLYEANRISFIIVSAGENRGFSGATNLGASVAKGRFILLLNSDVIPVEPGWMGKMIAAIDASPAVGIVGARLLYPNGSLQHDGISFVWEHSWSAYLNKHPRSGLEPVTPVTDRPSRQIAVTAACLLLDRSTYDTVGGLDEGFLIGDFEDSDLCLKVRQLGLDVVMVTDVTLIHLERQSFQQIGLEQFREQVARYNAWRHDRRWRAEIRRLLIEFQQTVTDP